MAGYPSLNMDRCKAPAAVLFIALLFQVHTVFAVSPSGNEDATAKILRKLEAIEQHINAIDQRVRKLEAGKAELRQALEKPYISSKEPGVAARLKAVESQVMSYRQAARTVESLEGISAGGGLTVLGQGRAGPTRDKDKGSAINYRADATVSLPAGEFGNAKGFIFTHFRMGAGLGLENPDSAFSSLNSTSFQRPQTVASDSTVTLAEAWYQFTLPLPVGGNPGLSRQHMEFNIGKMDPFVFFDQNAIVDDETRGFINQSFVHNPLLDTGGDAGLDDFGFTPGVRLAYVNEVDNPVTYGLSVGVFGAGDNASFKGNLKSPFVIVQAETEQRFFGGLGGQYRLYAWNNGQGVDIDGAVRPHSGIGFSMDQQVGDYISMFGRYGHQFQGNVEFNQTVTIGAEFGGAYWERSGDALGIALGWLNSSGEFRQTSTANGSEQLAEIFYRYRFNDFIALSPDFQYVRHPGGDKASSGFAAYGLRTQINF